MPNRLENEASLYLRQHAQNPVGWWPWGDEAFAEAKRRDVPVLLSIGYSTCYWCHVMERESFESDEIAQAINRTVVPVKVDREERPDIDELYMAATQIMTGRGGWPMTVLLDPASRRPFFCGTYFPPEDRGQMPGLPRVLQAMADAWANRREEVNEQAEQLTRAVSQHLGAADRDEQPAGPDAVADAVGSLLRMHDQTHGGFGGAPKFPQPAYGLFLLEVRQSLDTASRNAVDRALTHTLDRMSVGGLFDHAGGGFHRYCVDATWTVPHFEKMLYDNALLLALYAQAAAAFDDAWYRLVARRTAAYLLRDMRTTGGLLAAAQDAESEHREGRSYVWDRDEAKTVLQNAGLSEHAVDAAMTAYGLNADPNFQDPHHPDEPARFVLRLQDRPDRIAAGMGLTEAELAPILEQANAAFLQHRETRVQPARDDKAVTAWCAMAAWALATAAEPLAQPELLEEAQACLAGLLERVQNPEGDLARTWTPVDDRDPAIQPARRGPPGVLEDAAWVITAATTLARLNPAHDARWFETAAKVAADTMQRFADENGVLHDSVLTDEELFVRPRSTYDGATPSGVSQMLLAMVQLAEAADEREADADRWRDAAASQLHALQAPVRTAPLASVVAVHGLYRMLRHRPLYAQRYPFAPAGATPPPQADEKPQPIEVYASEERVQVAPDRPAVFSVLLRMPEGMHVNAAKQTGEAAKLGVVPLRVGLVSGQGVAVYAEYPDGEPLGVEGFEVLGHRGDVEFRVIVEHAKGVGVPGSTAEDRPILGLTYQACDESACMEPATVELDIAVDVFDEAPKPED